MKLFFVGGETFVKAIEMQIPVIQDVEINVDVENKKELPVVLKSQKIVSNDGDIVQSLNNLFNPHYQCDKNRIILSLIKVFMIF